MEMVKNMNMHNTINLVGALVASVLMTTWAGAQEEKVADQDLIKLLESVNQDEAPATPETVEDSDVVDAMDSLDASAGISEEGTDTNATDEVVDNVGMSEMDEVVGSTYGNLISVRLDKVGLEDAINLFAQLSGANIIVPELTEAAQISVNLKDVEWRPALQSILDTYNYELYQKVSGSNVYSVRRRPEGAPEPQVVETFFLKYATVPNAARLVKDLLPETAKISEFASRNILVIKSTESSLSEVRTVLDSIDTVRQQVYIESKFMELSDAAQKDLGIDWQVLQGYGASASANQYSYENISSKTSSDGVEQNRFFDVSGNEFEQASGYSENQRGGSSFAPWTLSGVTPALANMASSGSTENTTEVLTTVLSADEFRLVLSALEENSGVNVVSNPKIIVANEELANISIVRKEPNLKQEREQQLNDQPATTVFSLDPDQPYFEYGIRLDVVPSINTSSNITVNINPSLTRKFADKPAGEVTYPIIDEKSIQTVFNLASGQTAAIGGLTEVSERDVERKVPLLGSIPFLGRLFRYDQTVRGQDETIIFVTVGLANTQELDAETGLPEDSELARRQVINDENSRKLREQGRIYYKAGEDDKLEDMMKVMQRKEQDRVEQRERQLMKAAERAARREAKEEDPAEKQEQELAANK